MFLNVGTVVLANELRKRLDSLLALKIKDPSFNLSENPVVEAIVRLLTTDGLT